MGLGLSVGICAGMCVCGCKCGCGCRCAWLEPYPRRSPASHTKSPVFNSSVQISAVGM